MLRRTGTYLAELERDRSIPLSRKHARLAAIWRDLIHHTSFVDDLLAVELITERQLRMLTCPVRAVYGNDSNILHHGQVLGDLISQCGLSVLPGLDHFVLARDPEVVRAIVLDWLTTETIATPAGLP